MSHHYRFFVDRKITAKGGGDHVRVIDVAADQNLILAANLANEKMVAQDGETGVQHDPSATAIEQARTVAEKQLKRGEEITSVASVNLDDIPPQYGAGLPL